jgi:SAM-dependent methyltransferase
MINIEARLFDKYLVELVRRFKSLELRQGSEAFNNFVSASQYIPAYRWITNNIANSAKVLDWGCGNGHFSDFLWQRGYDVIPYGFDPPDFLLHVHSAAAERYIRAKTNVSLPFETASFDLVTSIGVLEHVREFGGTEDESLEEIFRVLRPGGVFFCFHFPNRSSWIEILSSVIGKWNHKYRFTRIDIERLCASVGLELQDCVRYGFMPRNVLGRWPFRSMLKANSADNCFESADDVLEELLAPICQNWMFSAKKPAYG